MYKPILWAFLSVFLAAMLVSAPSLLATTINADFTGTGYGYNVHYLFNGQNHSNWAGQFNMDLSSSTPYPGITDPFIAYCVDLARTLDAGWETYDVKLLSTIPDNWTPPNNDSGSNPKYAYPDGKQIAWLIQTYQLGGLITDNYWGAALQSAIWKAEFQEDFTLLSGVHETDSTIVDHYNSIMNALATANYSNSEGFWLDTSCSQDLAVGRKPTGLTPVPEPSTLLLTGGALLGLAALKLRKTK